MTDSGLSPATGKPHLFARMYPEETRCVWCGRSAVESVHIRAAAVTQALQAVQVGGPEYGDGYWEAMGLETARFLLVELGYVLEGA